MIAVVLVLLNITTAILLGGIEDGLYTWRLSQHDLRLARSSRAADSARAYVLAQFENGLEIAEALDLPNALEADIRKSGINCTEIPGFEPDSSPETIVDYQCWGVVIDIQQTTHHLRVQRTFWLIDNGLGERTWQN